MTHPETRLGIVAETRRWIGTPYQHQASVKGVGCNCLGLVRGIWRYLHGAEPEVPPAYSPDWAERRGDETLLRAAQRWLESVDPGEAQPGDVLLFRPTRDAPAKHCAIASAPGKIIHAYWGRAVAETSLSPWWDRRLAGVFQFPSQVK
tara:strand:+ start:240 stop:683 length:444 start_codon:yes stop_codon:yes gene_type:complete